VRSTIPLFCAGRFVVVAGEAGREDARAGSADSGGQEGQDAKYGGF
jgi:hypothetical protein